MADNRSTLDLLIKIAAETGAADEVIRKLQELKAEQSEIAAASRTMSSTGLGIPAEDAARFREVSLAMGSAKTAMRELNSEMDLLGRLGGVAVRSLGRLVGYGEMIRQIAIAGKAVIDLVDARDQAEKDSGDADRAESRYRTAKAMKSFGYESENARIAREAREAAARNDAANRGADWLAAALAEEARLTGFDQLQAEIAGIRSRGSSTASGIRGRTAGAGQGPDAFAAQRAEAARQLNEETRTGADELQRQETILQDMNAAYGNAYTYLQRLSAGDKERVAAAKAAADQAGDEAHRQSEKVEKLKAEVAARREVAVAQKAAADAEIGKRESEATARGREKELGIVQQFRSALAEQFELEARLKGVEDQRVASAYGYLSAAGRTLDAQRLLSIELEKQKRTGESLVSLAARQIVGAGGLNVNAIAGRYQGADRGYVATLASGFQNDYSRERDRLAGGRNMDRGAQQQQLAAWVQQRLEASPDLKAALGAAGGPGGDKAAGADKERAGILHTEEILRAKDANAEALRALGKAEVDLHKDVKGYSAAVAASITDLRTQLKDVQTRIAKGN